MEQEKKQAVALMRYSAIAPLITGTQEDYESLSAYFRTASAKGIKAPDGSLRHYSPGTLEKWYLAYRKSGFDALVPTGRSDCGVSRKIDDDLKEQIRYLKHHYPRMSAAAIYKQLQDNGSIRSDSSQNLPSAVSSISSSYRSVLQTIRICGVTKGLTSMKFGAGIPVPVPI